MNLEGLKEKLVLCFHVIVKTNTTNLQISNSRQCNNNCSNIGNAEIDREMLHHLQFFIVSTNANDINQNNYNVEILTFKMPLIGF